MKSNEARSASLVSSGFSVLPSSPLISLFFYPFQLSFPSVLLFLGLPFSRFSPGFSLSPYRASPFLLWFFVWVSAGVFPRFLVLFSPIPPPVGCDSLFFYKAKIGGNDRPPKCPVTEPLSAFNDET